MEVKDREAQGRYCEVRSEGSVEQKCELTNRNWINRHGGRTSWPEATKSISIKDRSVNPAVVHRKYLYLPREISLFVGHRRTIQGAILGDG